MELKKLIGGVCLVLLLPVGAGAQDVNLHYLTGTMSAQSCEWFPSAGKFLCGASIKVTAPEPHFSSTNPVFIPAELIGEAIGQSGVLTLPRRVMVLYFLTDFGTDEEYPGIIRSPVKAYYVYDLGPT